MIRVIRPRLLPSQQKELAKRIKNRSPWNSMRGEQVKESIKRLLVLAFHDKCGYCERRGSSIDHLRPKRESSPGRSTVTADEPTRTWDWHNLVWCCERCQLEKSNLPASESNRSLVDPCRHEPLAHLLFLPATGRVHWWTRHGEYTVKKLLKLNDHALVDARRRKFYRVIGLVDQVLAMTEHTSGYTLFCDLLLRELGHDQEFLGQFRQIILLDRDPYHSKFMQLFTVLPGIQQIVDRWCLPFGNELPDSAATPGG